MKAIGHSDICQGDWVDRYLPALLQPYFRLARLDRPIGTWLLLYPCLWAIFLADQNFTLHPHSWFLAALFCLGALLMRSAGCIINDLWDQKFDQQVERTQTRPLASGTLTRKQAYLFLGLHLFLSLLILTQLNPLTQALSIASLALVIIYPSCKRITYFPQIVLGFTFNWGALTGWTAVSDSLSLAPFILYIGGISWTMIYDTIYAHQDKVDDERIGLRSTALYFKSNTKIWLSVFSFLTIACFTTVGLLLDRSYSFYIGIFAITIHFLWQLKTLDIDDPENCLTRFKANRMIGLFLLIAIFIDDIFLSLG